MRKIRKILSKATIAFAIFFVGNLILDVLKSLGIFPFLVAILSGTIVTVSAAIEGLPASVAFVLMLATFVLVLLIFWLGFSLVRLRSGEKLSNAFTPRQRTQWEQEWHDQRDVRREFWRLMKEAYQNWGRLPQERSLLDLVQASQFLP